ncbi:MAG: PH domain-containing protein [Candidatus Magasanikbacteria bacterium]|nr:PH domain-containing protein [Candidatus Magasanikbacteria bacterium]
MLYSQVIKQKSYEKIAHLLRRDIVTFVPYVFFLILLLGVEVGVYFLLKTLFPDLFLKNITLAVLYIAGFIYTLSVWLFFYTAFVNYFLDMWIVTTDRIVDIRQMGLFSRTVAELDLFRVQDVTSEEHGLFATMFDFGNVYIQTAGEKERFIFYNVAEPHKIREAVIHLADEDRKFHNTNKKKE